MSRFKYELIDKMNVKIGTMMMARVMAGKVSTREEAKSFQWPITIPASEKAKERTFQKSDWKKDWPKVRVVYSTARREAPSPT